MSKQRAQARAAREASAARRAAELKIAREKEAAERARREKRARMWRHLRLWQRGTSGRRRESFGWLGTLVLVVLLIAWIVTRSATVVVGTALVLIVAGPVLGLLFFDRRHK